ncbi:MAG: hypothetical protein E6Q97_37385 [Desulfurellales bacterium]|nr:MAG: hypothetical protein E6Q97_37385 [Desulfurellales bacterium]
MRIALFDLSSSFRMHWHASEALEMGAAFTKTVNDVVASTAGFDAVAVCVDRPPYRRKEIYGEYKAQREKAPEAMYEQQRAVVDQLDADGYHIVGADGYEADDVIGTLVSALSGEHEIMIFSSDKDLLQLVSPSVHVVSVATRQKFGTLDVVEKFGVTPELIPDFLALCGDKSDNIPGLAGCGAKTAAAWLAKHGPLEYILTIPDQISPERFRQPLKDNAATLAKSLTLTRLMLDAPIKPEEILTTKEKKEAPGREATVIDGDQDAPPPATATTRPATTPSAVVVRPPDRTEPAAAPADWEKSLEPRTPTQAWQVAQALYKSRLFGEYPNPEAILAIVMTGRAHGLDAVASLRGMHLIKGRVAPSAQLMIGMVKRSAVCEWFRLVSSDAAQSTWETKRRDEPEPTRLTYTIEMATRAGLAQLDQWKKRPETMMRWRCGAELARLVYPDVTTGLLAAEELEG